MNRRTWEWNVAEYRAACEAVQLATDDAGDIRERRNNLRSRFWILAHLGRRYGWPAGMAEDKLREMAPENHRDGLLPRKEL